MNRSGAFERYARLTDAPLTIVALAMVPLLLVPLFVELSAGTERAVLAVDYFIWAIFAVDYVIRLTLSPERWRYVRTHVPDLIIVIVPFLRPLRILRSARALRLLRLVRLTAFMSRGFKQVRTIWVRRGLNYVVLFVVGLVFLSAAIMRAVEQGAEGSNITSFPDALWWAATTITTVGYGDRFPVTAAGRGVAVALMIFGIALLGIVTANIAAFFVQQEQSSDQTSELNAIRRQLDAIQASLDTNT